MLQGLAVLAWWAFLAGVPAGRDLFAPGDADPGFLWAFLPADLLLVAGGSLAAARAWTSSSVPTILWVAAGGLWYATLYVSVLWYLSLIPPLGPVMMLVASAGTAWTVAGPSDR